MTERNRAVMTRGRSVSEMVMLRNAVNKDSRFAVAIYLEGACPSCGGHDFHPGPHGGLAENIKCKACGAKWWISIPFDPTPIVGADSAFDHSRTFDLREYFRAEGEA